MKHWLKTELHAHTVDDPHDGGRFVLHSARELIDAAAQQGFEVLSITNHNQLLFSRGLERYAAKRGILLIPGVEATLEGKHVLLYDFPAYNTGWDRFQTVARHKGAEQMVVAAHPFFPSSTALGKLLLRWLDLFDAVEFNHFYLRKINFNKRAERVARQFRLPLVGNSDVHHLFQLGSTYTLVYAEKEKTSILNAIKNGEVQLVTRPVSLRFIARWFTLAGRAQSRYLISKVFSRCHSSAPSGARQGRSKRQLEVSSA